MTVNIPIDAETELLARRLSEFTGRPLPMIFREALEAQAANAGLERPFRPSRDAVLARMRAITDEFADLPVLDGRSADEIIGYGDDGVPQ